MLNGLCNIVIFSDVPNLLQTQFYEIQNQKQQNMHQNMKNYHQSQYRPEQFQQLVEQLKQSQNQLKAIKFRLKNLVQKVFKGFNISNKKQKEQKMLTKCFQIWKQQMLINKIQNKIIKKKVYTQLKKNKKLKQDKNMNIIKHMTAENSHERCLKAIIFFQWKLTTKTQKKSRQLLHNIKKNRFRQLITTCQQRKTVKFTKQLAVSIYKQKLQKKYFFSLIDANKICKIQKLIFKNKSLKFIKRIKKHLTTQKITYQQRYNKQLLLKSFFSFKNNWKNEKYSKYYQNSLLKKYFKLWIQEGKQLFLEKQQQNKNQEILQQYLKRKDKLKLLYSFEIWRKSVEQKIQNRKKNQIAKQYGQVKQKQFLLRKYFNAMKEMKFYNKADQLYQMKLKNKVFIVIKQQIIKVSQKLENVYKFVENRQKRKYFNAIKTFITNDLFKVLRFRTEKAWFKFSFGIVKNYVQLNKKADQFYQKSLKFKTIFGLKEQLQFKNKTNKVIIFINANMNLRRWRKNHNIIQFVEQRKFVILAKIFRQLKLLRMNKIWSEPEIQQSKNTQKKAGFFSNRNNFITQTSLTFDKITMQSPQKLFSLDYSISAYNSNNVFDNM